MLPDLKSVLCHLINDNSDSSELLSQLEQLNSDPLNWESFFKMAYDEKLLPMLWYACKRKSILHLVPASLQASMQTAYMSNMGRTYFLKNQLSEVLTAFNKKNVKIMLLKGGVHLIETIYPDINTRMMSDIDFMILPEDIPGAKQIFLDLGFTCVPDPWGENVKMNFIKDQFNFELHTQPFSEIRIPAMNPEEMWQRARKKMYGGSVVYLPSPYDLLFHCIFHELIQHNRLFDLSPATLYEVDQILKAFKKKIDLVALFHHAKRYRLEVHLSFFLKELECSFCGAVPPTVKQWVDDIVSQFNPLFNQVNQLPLFLQRAGQRFFNFFVLYELHQKRLINFYRYYIRPILYSPADKVLRDFGLKSSFSFFLPLIQAIDIIKTLMFHSIVRYFYIKDKKLNTLKSIYDH